MRMGPFVVFLGMLACACNGEATPPLSTLPTTAITVTSPSGDIVEELVVELATTGPQRAQGLMYRQDLPEDRGMLFLFETERSGGFWMQNTLIPLDIAYLSADGTVLEIVKGTPLDTTILNPAQPYRHTLEVNQGWFERHRLGPGAHVAIPTQHVPSPQSAAPSATP
jgi:uncharacterized membrane protein (UPF0127 family)